MRKKLKIVTAYILIFSAMLMLTSCGEIKKAENSVNNMFIALKNLDFEGIQNYINTNGNDTDADIELAQPILEITADNIDYRIISSQQTDDNTVIVKTEITSANLVPAMSEYISQAFQFAFENAFSQTPLTEEEQDQKMTELFTDIIANAELEPVTNEVDIKVIKNENNSWIIQTDDKLENAIFGGLVEEADKIENITE